MSKRRRFANQSVQLCASQQRTYQLHNAPSGGCECHGEQVAQRRVGSSELVLTSYQFATVRAVACLGLLSRHPIAMHTMEGVQTVDRHRDAKGSKILYDLLAQQMVFVPLRFWHSSDTRGGLLLRLFRSSRQGPLMSLTDPKQTNPSTRNPFASAAGPMRADFEMTSGLFQARPVSRLTARVTYHAAAASMPAARHQRGRIEAAWCRAIPCPLCRRPSAAPA